MAVLTSSAVTKKLPVGDLYQQTYLVSNAGTAAADEWFVTGFRNVVTVVGAAVLGTAPDISSLNFVLNAEGTGQSAGSTPGSVGIEVITAGTNSVHVTVLGEA